MQTGTLLTGFCLGERSDDRGRALAAIAAAGLLSHGAPRTWAGPLPDQMMQEWLGLQPTSILGDLNYIADMSAHPAGPVVMGLLSATIDDVAVSGPLLVWSTETAPEWEQLCRDLPRCSITRICGYSLG